MFSSADLGCGLRLETSLQETSGEGQPGGVPEPDRCQVGRGGTMNGGHFGAGESSALGWRASRAGTHTAEIRKSRGGRRPS